MRTVRHSLTLAFVTLLAACASSGTLGQDGVTRLEQAHRDNPTNQSTNRSLGIAYYKSDRLSDAREALGQAVRADPADGTAQLYLGLTAEAQGDLEAARQAYSSYVSVGRTARVHKLLEERLAALTRKEMEASAKQEVADESRLAAVPGSPKVVAVLPMRFSGPDTSLKPLERGLAELLSTDLSRSSQLTVVERLRTQTLLDEIHLQQSGATDEATGVRAGRMLQAGRLISGAIQQTGDNLRVDAAIIDVPSTHVVSQPTDNSAIDQLFTLEKNLAFKIFDSLGVRLSTAEHDAIEQRPTKSLAAFLAYSRGLTLSDEGQYDDANRFFDQAVRLDPGFKQALQQGQQAHSASQGQQVTASTVENTLKGTTEGQVVQGATQGVVVGAGSSAGTAASTASDLNPSSAGAAASGSGTTTTQAPGKNNPAATGTGTDNVTSKTATVVIVIRAPHS
jgi:tetratricopeptide (TPR) repeat protein